jgi:membrane protein DedA with SNARE-associated domain
MLTLATLTGQLTTWVAQHGVAAVFVLMAIDALLPIGGELIMLYAGVIAAGAIGGVHASLFGTHLSTGLESFLVLCLAGTLGSLAGSLVAWYAGRRGGRAFIERRGRWLHLTPAKLHRAERWFDRYGALAVLLGRLTPLVRSFISIPAGALGSPLGAFTALTLLASTIWSLVFAGVGWALGSSWQSFDHAFRYVDYAAVAAVVVVAVALVLRRRSSPSPSVRSNG